jgi:hypothetical protein
MLALNMPLWHESYLEIEANESQKEKVNFLGASHT